MKKTLIFVIVVAILVVGYMHFSGRTKQAEVINNNNNNSAKIHPRVACESALAYMTFQSSEEAGIFVEECVNGQHPDVVERYIKDMGFDRTTI